MTAPVRRTALAVAFAAAVTGCQQKMAEQPAPRPFEQSSMFPHEQSARPRERGVVHRNQRTDDDPLVTWLTEAGKNPQPTPEFKDSVDKDGKIKVPAGAPTSVDNFVKEFPFELTEDDLKRGQSLYTTNCALCHGAAGDANGKIPERGFLRPPSYHTDPAGKLTDWSTLNHPSQTAAGGPGLPKGYSRGFNRFGVRVALKDVPVGYIFQVITWGYGGMAAHDVQLASPADRWRVAAYVRTLQFSQQAPVGDLPKDLQDKIPATGGKK